MTKVRLDNITKRFGDFVAVDALNLEIADKEFFILLGPSGCGKTTTLNMIAGLETITEGTISFDDQVVNKTPAEKRDVAMVFQSFGLYSHMTAYQNIMFPLKIRKVPERERKKKVEEAASTLQISHLLSKRPHEMSGGERQRVALARSIVRNPRVFLMDEPLSNIDAKLRGQMRAELISLQKQLQTTTIYVTHDQIEAITMGDRVAVMNNGKLVQLDEPIKTYESPVNQFVAGFIGSIPMNFFECDVVQDDGHMMLKTSEFSLTVPEVFTKVLRGSESKPLILGVRPHDISVAKTRGEGTFESKVFAVEPLGTEVIVDIRVGNQIVKSVMPPTFRATIGSTLYTKIDTEKIHIFEKNSGKALV